MSDEEFNKAMFANQESTDDRNPRKGMPLFSGLLAYFPDALLEVSKVSVAGNKQHNNGDELKWDRSKSTDQLDSSLRHLTDHAKGNYIDDDGLYHLSKTVWRLLAELQIFLEERRENGEEARYGYLFNESTGEWDKVKS